MIKLIKFFISVIMLFTIVSIPQDVAKANNVSILKKVPQEPGLPGGAVPPGGGIAPKPKPTPKPKPSKPKLPAKGFKTGAEGEKYLNDLLNGNGHKTYKTKYGKRVADVYVKKNNWIHESKVGYASKTKFIKKQVKKDAWLKKEKVVKGVKWHFFKSAKTGKIGASKPLLQYLKENKIPYEIHKK